MRTSGCRNRTQGYPCFLECSCHSLRMVTDAWDLKALEDAMEQNASTLCCIVNQP